VNNSYLHINNTECGVSFDTSVVINVYSIRPRRFPRCW